MGFFTPRSASAPACFMHKSWGGSHEPRRRPRAGAGCRLGITRGSRPAPTNCAGNCPPGHGKCLVEVGRENGVLRPLRTGLGSTFYFCALFGRGFIELTQVVCTHDVSGRNCVSTPLAHTTSVLCICFFFSVLGMLSLFHERQGVSSWTNRLVLF